MKPILIYNDPLNQKRQIYNDLHNKGGIYLWTNIISNKKYVGSSVNLVRRLQSYLNKNFLERELKTNYSIIYKALLKYEYKNFKLEILEFCEAPILMEREQYYLDSLNLEYNIRKIAKNSVTFNYDKKSEIIKKFSNKRKHSGLKYNICNNTQCLYLAIQIIETEEVLIFPSIRRASLFINIHHSYLAKCIKTKGIYEGKGFIVKKPL